MRDMDYFGARYYDSGLSIWLSVDPLASNFAWISSYSYVYNNPIKFIDKWGLFGTKKEVRKFAKNNGVKTGIWWFRNYKIKKHNGKWTLYNKENNSYTYDDNGTIRMESSPGIVKFQATKPKKVGVIKKIILFFKGIGMYGSGSDDNGNTSGDKGEYDTTVDFVKVNNWDKPNPFKKEKKEKVPDYFINQKREYLGPVVYPSKVVPQSVKGAKLDPDEYVKVKIAPSNKNFGELVIDVQRKDSLKYANEYNRKYK